VSNWKAAKLALDDLRQSAVMEDPADKLINLVLDLYIQKIHLM
jgi:hypothetical protein